MVKIRLSRTGKKNYATYRIVVLPAKTKRETKSIEQLGYYLPHDKKVEINKERATYWLGVGAQPTETVMRLLVKEGVMKAPKYKKTYSHKAGKKATERAAKKSEAAEQK